MTGWLKGLNTRMATFRGFTTIDRFKRFSETDFELIKTDLINAFNIRQGEKPGKPEFGSSLWAFIFEPLTNDVVQKIIQEAERVIAKDPRLTVDNINVFTQDNGVILELSLRVNAGATPLDLKVKFDQENRRVQLD